MSAADADLLYSGDEDALRDSIRRRLAQRATPAAVSAVYDQPLTDVGPWWEALVELGAAALLVPEEHEGAGASAREAAVVAEEIGRTCTPTPFLTSAVIATTLLQDVGAVDLLPSLAAGESVAALVLPFSADALSIAGRTHAVDVLCRDGRLHGHVRSVAGAVGASHLLVPVAADGELALHLVAAGAEGVAVTPVLSLDMTRPVADVVLTDAPSLVLSGAAAPAVTRALTVGAAVLASEQLGVAQWCLETTLGYVKERKQFGRPIGGFQAIKHRMADLFLDVSLAGAAARYAADCAARQDDDLPVAAAVAASCCGDIAVRAAEECVQLHGGLGMTWEYPAHLYLKKAKADQLALGTGYRHRAALAALAGLSPS